MERKLIKMNLKTVLKKQGGFKLIKQYIKSGAIFTAVFEFLLLGKSRTSLEILRLSTSLKTKQKLEKKYKKDLLELDKKYDKNLKKDTSNKIWICWFQGMENAPLLVKKCYESVKKKLKGKEIIVITDDNMNDYVKFPKHILEKYEKGIITRTHMTDLLRLELLTQYGGMWLDATVLVSEKIDNIPNFYFESDLFFYQSLKPGRDGHCTYMSSWLMSSKTNNKILLITRDLLYKYWEKNNSMVDYFLLHHFLSIVLDYHEDEWKKIVPKDNATPHILLLRLFDKYDENIWNSMMNGSPFHKLTYKFDKEKEALKNTNYKKIIN